MGSPLKGGAVVWGLALGLAAPALLFPLYNPDLFWHLSAGRWIIGHGALPHQDFLSFTAPGAPWLDFEWLSQLIFQAIYSVGGMAGLWGFKVFLLGASWLVVNAILRLHGASAGPRAAALVLWSAGLLAHSDIRPELFSILFFAWVLLVLEAWRLGKVEAGAQAGLGLFLIFALWSNLHAGFFFGLMLFAAYAAAPALEGRWGEAAEPAAGAFVGVLGSLCNPYGLGPYRVAWEHFEERAALSKYIGEWHPMAFENPLHWPFWALLAAVLIMTARAVSRRDLGKALPVAPILAAIYFGAGTLAHARVAAFFAAPAVLTIVLAARGAAGAAKKALVPCAVAYAVFLAWATPHISWAGFFNYKYVPRPAAEFMARERPALEPLRLYNQWEWGGYLGWRLHPWFKVYGDGRYIFHHQLIEAGEAALDSGRWRAFMGRNGLQGALLPNIDTVFPTQRRYPDGSRRDFLRPWYVFYMPIERWALVYWDDQALLFVDRRAVASDWLERVEFRYVRPKDEAAFEDALRRGELPARQVEEERRRRAP